MLNSEGKKLLLDILREIKERGWHHSGNRACISSDADELTISREEHDMTAGLGYVLPTH